MGRSAQQLYVGLTRLRFGLPVAQSVVEDLAACRAGAAPMETGPALPLRQALRFDDVTFRYPGTVHAGVERLNLEIRSGTSVGIVGKTGAGKTTVVDLVLGLLDPSEGRILIDGVPLSDANRRAGQRSIGYMPQSIFLADASVANNIAFGIAPEAIDGNAVERAARVANIHEFVTGELPSGYKIVIGERRAAVGWPAPAHRHARALYHDPSVLVFDEATSALDNTTEKAVMEAVARLSSGPDIIIIAHLLTTVRDRDQIILLEYGKVDAKGSFDELVKTSEPSGRW